MMSHDLKFKKYHLPVPSAKESVLPSNKSSALMMLRKLVEDLHGFIPELRSQVDKERQMVTKLQKEKVCSSANYVVLCLLLCLALVSGNETEASEVGSTD